jgi:hypothetical protein
MIDLLILIFSESINFQEERKDEADDKSILGFQGHWSLYEKSGTLYFFRTRMGEVGPWYPQLSVSESPPEGGIGSFKDVREARLDLSGFALRIGLRVRLF